MQAVNISAIHQLHIGYIELYKGWQRLEEEGRPATRGTPAN